MSWMDIYRRRVTTAEEAVRQIRSGQRVFLTGNCSVPQTVVGALVNHAMGLENVELCQVLTFGKAEYAKPELAGHLRINTLFISDTQRAAVHEGRGDFTTRDSRRNGCSPGTAENIG